MEVSIGQTHFYDRIWAALIFFTRLPFWRLYQPPKACYETTKMGWPISLMALAEAAATASVFSIL